MSIGLMGPIGPMKSRGGGSRLQLVVFVVLVLFSQQKKPTRSKTSGWARVPESHCGRRQKEIAAPNLIPSMYRIARRSHTRLRLPKSNAIGFGASTVFKNMIEFHPNRSCTPSIGDRKSVV